MNEFNMSACKLSINNSRNDNDLKNPFDSGYDQKRKAYLNVFN